MIGTVACVVGAQEWANATRTVPSNLTGGAGSSHWLERRLDILESRACAATGDAVPLDAVGEPTGLARGCGPQAHAWLVSEDPSGKAVARWPPGPRRGGASRSARAWLAAARISYGNGDRADGHRSLQRALRLGSLSGSGCRSSWNGRGSGVCCGPIPTWLTFTGTCWSPTWRAPSGHRPRGPARVRTCRSCSNRSAGVSLRCSATRPRCSTPPRSPPCCSSRQHRQSHLRATASWR